MGIMGIMDDKVKSALDDLLIALENASQFGIIRTESGTVITGAKESGGGIVLTEDKQG